MARFKISDVYKVPYTIMNTSGIWPKTNPSSFYKIKTFFSWFFAIGLLSVQSMEAICNITNFAKLSEIGFIMVTMATFNIKLGILFYRKQTFLEMIAFLENPLFNSFPDNMNDYLSKKAKFLGYVSRTVQYLFLSCACLFLISPIFDNKPLPFGFPFELGPYNSIMYVFQSVSELFAAWNDACMDALCVCMMAVAVVQLDILKEKIIHVGDENLNLDSLDISEKTDSLVIKKLTNCIEHHLAIIKFIDYVEQIFSTVLFLQFMTSAIVICNTLFHFVLIKMSAEFFILVDYFVCMLIELFIYCWYGNEIIVKSIKIGEACFNSYWYLNGKNLRKHLFIVMERAKRPLKITTMRFTVLSLVMFASILQWSYSCLMLLLKMYYKQQKGNSSQ